MNGFLEKNFIKWYLKYVTPPPWVLLQIVQCIPMYSKTLIIQQLIIQIPDIICNISTVLIFK